MQYFIGKKKQQQLASCHFVHTPSSGSTPSPSPVVLSNTPRASKSPTPVATSVQAPDHEELTAIFSSLASCKTKPAI